MRPEQFKAAMAEALRRQLATNQPVRLPAGGADLWSWFNTLSRARSWHANGPNPLSHVEIAAFASLHRLPLKVHHVEILTVLDGVFIDAWQALRDTAQGAGKTLPPRSAAPLTAGLFDAMFG